MLNDPRQVHNARRGVGQAETGMLMHGARKMFGTGIERVGVAGLLVFALSALAWQPGAQVGLVLVVLIFVLSAAAWRSVARESVFLICAAFAVYVVARGIWAAIESPDFAKQQLDGIVDWLRLLPFICVGWLLARNEDRLGPVLLLALVGFLLGMVTHPNWLRFDEVVSGELRTGFRFRVIASGLYTSTALLGLVVFAPRLIGTTPGRARIIRGVLWVVVLVAITAGFVASQTRGAWLALILVLPPVLLLRYRTTLRSVRSWSGRRWTGIVAVVVVLGTVLAVGMGEVLHRTFVIEGRTIEMLSQGKDDEAPRTSLRYRFHLQRFGLEKWLERPLFGWGPGATSRAMIDPAQHPELMHPDRHGASRPLAHFHNTYLEILVRFGLVGAALLGAVAWFLLRGVWAADRSRIMPADCVLFVAGAFGLTAVWSMFNYNVPQYDWRDFAVLIVGAAYAFRLRALARI